MFKRTDSECWTKCLTIITVSLLFSQGAAAPERNTLRDEQSAPLYLQPVEFASSNSPPFRCVSSNSTDEIYPENSVRTERHAYDGKKWNNGIVPYTIDPSFPSHGRPLIARAIHEFSKKTCIRFVPKTGKHRDYVNIQVDNEVCGEANVCRKGGKQYAKIGRGCMNMNTVVHELGHSICMAHEHERQDRDQFIQLTKNVDKNDHNFAVADSDHTTLGLLYDYESVMHYGCPHYFKAKSGQVKSCGGGDELSILDAEKINTLYDCGGCLSYRFRQPHKADKFFVPAGYDIDGHKLGVCRAYVNGEIIPGKYRRSEGKCYIPWGNKEHLITKGYEVLTLPNPKYFSWKAVKNGKVPGSAVAGGRVNGKVPLYIGRCHISLNKKKSTVPGKIHHGRMYYTFGGKEYVCGDFEVFTCSAKR